MKLLAALAVASTVFSTAAYSDTIGITFGAPSGSPIKVTVQVGDGPVQSATVTSSSEAIGPLGCNYTWLIVGDKADGEPVATKGHNNQGCGPK